MKHFRAGTRRTTASSHFVPYHQANEIADGNGIFGRNDEIEVCSIRRREALQSVWKLILSPYVMAFLKLSGVDVLKKDINYFWDYFWKNSEIIGTNRAIVFQASKSLFRSQRSIESSVNHEIDETRTKILTVAVDELAVLDENQQPAEWSKVCLHWASLSILVQRKFCKKTALNWCSALFSNRSNRHRDPRREGGRGGLQRSGSIVVAEVRWFSNQRNENGANSDDGGRGEERGSDGWVAEGQCKRGWKDEQATRKGGTKCTQSVAGW